MSGEIAPALPQTLSYAVSSAGIAAWQESRRRHKIATKALDAAADALRAEQKRVAAQAKTRRRNTTNQATLRAGRRAVDKAVALDALAGLVMPSPPRIGRQVVRGEILAFRAWLATDGARQRQYRPHRRSYIRSRVLLLQMRLEQGVDPTPAEFAHRLGPEFDRRRSLHRLTQLAGLETMDGPWPPMTESGQPYPC